MNRYTTSLALVLMSMPLTTFAHEERRASGRIDYSRVEATAFGRAADPKRAQRTIRIDMSDAMRFSPAVIAIRRGERIRFVVTNSGKAMHEMVLGTLDELKAHGELMKKFPDMEHVELHMLHVAPGKTGEMGWHFTQAGEFQYGCLVPGHFDAGMVGRIRVIDR